ncbi:uncharacterized protein [Diadema antillarum]|uniref:uncharacterized protein n=1 Tax=Diadema antillarum TaxID=105358 RepID=UPI003A85115C
MFTTHVPSVIGKSSNPGLSLLSRGIGEEKRKTKSGHRKLEVCLEPEDYHNIQGRRFYLPPLQQQAWANEKHVSPREIRAHKTYTTRKGALLLYAEDLALTASDGTGKNRSLEAEDSSYFNSISDLRNAVLSYGSSNARPQPLPPTAEHSPSSSVYLGFVHNKRAAGPYRTVRPGFSAKRYLANWSRSWDDSILNYLRSEGHIWDKNLFQQNVLAPNLYRRINDDLSLIPMPYRVTRNMLVSPGEFESLEFYRIRPDSARSGGYSEEGYEADIGEGDADDENGDRRPRKKRKSAAAGKPFNVTGSIAMIVRDMEQKPHAVQYETLEPDQQREVLQRLLLQSALHQQQHLRMMREMKEEEEEAGEGEENKAGDQPSLVPKKKGGDSNRTQHGSLIIPDAREVDMEHAIANLITSNSTNILGGSTAFTDQTILEMYKASKLNAMMPVPPPPPSASPSQWPQGATRPAKSNLRNTYPSSLRGGGQPLPPIQNSLEGGLGGGDSLWPIPPPKPVGAPVIMMEPPTPQHPRLSGTIRGSRLSQGWSSRGKTATNASYESSSETNIWRADIDEDNLLRQAEEAEQERAASDQEVWTQGGRSSQKGSLHKTASKHSVHSNASKASSESGPALTVNSHLSQSLENLAQGANEQSARFPSGRTLPSRLRESMRSYKGSAKSDAGSLLLAAPGDDGSTGFVLTGSRKGSNAPSVASEPADVPTPASTPQVPDQPTVEKWGEPEARGEVRSETKEVTEVTSVTDGDGKGEVVEEKAQPPVKATKSDAAAIRSDVGSRADLAASTDDGHSVITVSPAPNSFSPSHAGDPAESSNKDDAKHVPSSDSVKSIGQSPRNSMDGGHGEIQIINTDQSVTLSVVGMDEPKKKASIVSLGGDWRQSPPGQAYRALDEGEEPISIKDPDVEGEREEDATVGSEGSVKNVPEDETDRTTSVGTLDDLNTRENSLANDNDKEQREGSIQSSMQPMDEEDENSGQRTSSVSPSASNIASVREDERSPLEEAEPVIWVTVETKKRENILTPDRIQRPEEGVTSSCKDDDVTGDSYHEEVGYDVAENDDEDDGSILKIFAYSPRKEPTVYQWKRPGVPKIPAGPTAKPELDQLGATARSTNVPPSSGQRSKESSTHNEFPSSVDGGNKEEGDGQTGVTDEGKGVKLGQGVIELPQPELPGPGSIRSDRMSERKSQPRSKKSSTQGSVKSESVHSGIASDDELLSDQEQEGVWPGQMDQSQAASHKAGSVVSQQEEQRSEVNSRKGDSMAGSESEVDVELAEDRAAEEGGLGGGGDGKASSQLSSRLEPPSAADSMRSRPATVESQLEQLVEAASVVVEQIMQRPRSGRDLASDAQMAAELWSEKLGELFTDDREEPDRVRSAPHRRRRNSLDAASVTSSMLNEEEDRSGQRATPMSSKRIRKVRRLHSAEAAISLLRHLLKAPADNDDVESLSSNDLESLISRVAEENSNVKIGQDVTDMIENQEPIDSKSIVVIEDISERKIFLESSHASTDFSADNDTDGDAATEEEKEEIEEVPAPEEEIKTEREFIVRSRASVMEEEAAGGPTEGTGAMQLAVLSPRPPATASSQAPSVVVETPKGAASAQGDGKDADGGTSLGLGVTNIGVAEKAEPEKKPPLIRMPTNEQETPSVEDSESKLNDELAKIVQETGLLEKKGPKSKKGSTKSSTKSSKSNKSSKKSANGKEAEDAPDAEEKDAFIVGIPKESKADIMLYKPMTPEPKKEEPKPPPKEKKKIQKKTKKAQAPKPEKLKKPKKKPKSESSKSSKDGLEQEEDAKSKASSEKKEEEEKEEEVQKEESEKDKEEEQPPEKEEEEEEEEEEAERQSPESPEFIFIHDEFSESEDEPPAPEPPEPEIQLEPTVSAVPSEDMSEFTDFTEDSTSQGPSSISRSQAKAFKRAAEAEKRRVAVEKKRREREEAKRKAQEEAERKERIQLEFEEEKRRKEAEARERAEREALDRQKQAKEEEERQRQAALAAERERRQQAEYKRKMEEMARKKKEEEAKKRAEEEVRRKEEEERQRLEAEQLAAMEEAERLEYEKRKRAEELEAARIAEEERIRREIEEKIAQAQAEKLALEMARRQKELEARLQFNKELHSEANVFAHSQEMTRAFTWSYFELLDYLGIEIPDSLKEHYKEIAGGAEEG